MTETLIIAWPKEFAQFCGFSSIEIHYSFNIFINQCHKLSNLWPLILQDLIHGLSTLCRGTLEEKLKWTFSLYDINKDGTISRDEMTMIVTAVYELMGKFAEQMMQDNTVSKKVDSLFQVRIPSYNSLSLSYDPLWGRGW